MVALSLHPVFQLQLWSQRSIVVLLVFDNLVKQAIMKWEVGQTVDVQSRTWAGINKPGGCARITKIHYAVDGLNVESIDVKYVLGGGCEKEIDPAIVSPFETLDRGGRKRRGRDFFMEHADNVVKKVKQAIRKKASDTAARTTTTHNRKTTAPDHSTSPSTPVTPEHPSMKVAKAPKLNLLSVPSYVIADRTVEVSPLPLDRAVIEPDKAAVVRRGLFGSIDGSTKAKQMETLKQSKLPVDKLPEDPTFHETVREVSQAHSAAMKRSLALKCGRNYASKLGATKRSMPVDDKPSDVKKATTKAHLKDVFDYELRKAKEFLEEVCRAPCAEQYDVDTSSKENRLNTSVCNSQSDQKPAALDRREEFLNVFQSLRRKFEEDDGMMDESEFMANISNRAENAFTKAEIHTHLEHLYQAGRLMKSDGVLYIID